MFQKNWQELIKPQKLRVEAGHEAGKQATIVARVSYDAGLLKLSRLDAGQLSVEHEPVVLGEIAAVPRRHVAFERARIGPGESSPGAMTSRAAQ